MISCSLIDIVSSCVHITEQLSIILCKIFWTEYIWLVRIFSGPSLYMILLLTLFTIACYYRVRSFQKRKSVVHDLPFNFMDFVTFKKQNCLSRGCYWSWLKFCLGLGLYQKRREWVHNLFILMCEYYTLY